MEPAEAVDMRNRGLDRFDNLLSLIKDGWLL